MVLRKLSICAYHARDCANSHRGNSSDRHERMALKKEAAFSQILANLPHGHNLALAEMQ